MIKLLPLKAEDREQFIMDNQVAFKFGALEEFGTRDKHFEEGEEIISKKRLKILLMVALHCVFGKMTKSLVVRLSK